MSAMTCSAANFADDCIRVLEHEAKLLNDELWWANMSAANGKLEPGTLARKT
jgi:hypothetical protein